MFDGLGSWQVVRSDVIVSAATGGRGILRRPNAVDAVDGNACISCSAGAPRQYNQCMGFVRSPERWARSSGMTPLCRPNLSDFAVTGLPRGLIIWRVTPAAAPNLRERLRRTFVAAVVIVAGLLAVGYGLDYVVFRIRVAANRNAYGSVMVNHYTAVLQKNGKTTLTFDPPQPWTCVNAFFPHAGSFPCWYLSRHPDQRTNI